MSAINDIFSVFDEDSDEETFYLPRTEKGNQFPVKKRKGEEDEISPKKSKSTNDSDIITESEHKNDDKQDVICLEKGDEGQNMDNHPNVNIKHEPDLNLEQKPKMKNVKIESDDDIQVIYEDHKPEIGGDNDIEVIYDKKFESKKLHGSSSSSSRRKHKMDEIKIKYKEAIQYFDEHLESMRIQIKTINTTGCLHEVTYPPGMEYQSLRECMGDPAKEFSFNLDPFQKEAIACIDSNESVLVSAHTSSGKTVVAEYAIALALREKQRVIYTTPIKALSNQKYREFEETFKDVGLITGDVTINHEAGCLIMTTEVLRNMLYRGSEIMAEVGWVIFDEIHYMRDKERGVVWEESLILLPKSIHSVFLSATIPNARQFAEWVSYIHHQPCHVIYTDVRPVPLQHYLYPALGLGVHLIVDEFGNFKEDNFDKAMSGLSKSNPKVQGRKRFSGASDPSCCNVIRMIMENDYAPVIAFSFSKKECETYAMQMSKSAKLDSATVQAINGIFENAIRVLSDEDQKLPQVSSLLFLLKRGIGIHHGGLLPILKEVVEILFAEGFLRTLFATETFAMGLNMPARTVLFTDCRKFDGKENRFLTSGEYIQMSGRAGRRGLDDKGLVIMMINEPMSPDVVKNITQGQADSLNSAFHLTYNMILNLLRVEEINPEYVIEKSFHQFQHHSVIPQVYEKVKALEIQADSLNISQDESVIEYNDIRKSLDTLGDKFRAIIFEPNIVVGFLQPGRLVKVKDDKNNLLDWGIILKYQRKNRNNIQSLLIDILVSLVKPEGENINMEVVTVDSSQLYQLSSIVIKYPKDLRSMDGKMEVYKTIEVVKSKFPNGVLQLNPVEHMNIKDSRFVDIVKSISDVEKRLFKHPLYNTSQGDQIYGTFLEKCKLDDEIEKTNEELKTQLSSSFTHELKCRKRVLRRMEYCTDKDVILKKGRVACELSSGDELLQTELIFHGVFNDLTVPQSVALLSCFFCDEKSNSMQKLTEELSGPLKKMQDLARNIARICNESMLQVDEDNFVASFKPHLMDVCYAWSNGSTFMDICKMTDIFEGSIIRCLRRMEECLRQLVQAARSIGNVDLETKFSDASKSIKRGIVFAASLYL